MQTYATALMIAIPFFIVLILFEVLYGYYKKNQTHNAFDTISSLSSGLTNLIKDSLGVVFIIVSYPFLLNYFALSNLEATWPAYVIGFIAIDFASYWSHRLSHHVNFFWNRHIIHHSSEEFNLACALRQSVSDLLGIFPLFLIPAAFIGVPAKVIAAIAPIHLFMQFWYHTRHMPKLGFLEYIIVTPSQHRVHHAINREYINKNLAAIFCIWDRLFGTFQEELDDVPPVYGVLHPVSTWNPVKINFQHLWNLMKDAWRTKSWKAKLLIWFMPTGWRPDDVKDKYPLSKIKDVYHFEKYKTAASRLKTFYAGYQLIASTALLLFMLSQFGNLENAQLWLYSGILFVSIYGYTSLMENDPLAIWIELLRGMIGLSVLSFTGGWFGLGEAMLFGDVFAAFYFFSSMIGAIYFTFFESEIHSNSTVSH